MVGPAAKREGVAHLQAAPDLSERRAFSILKADRDDQLPLMPASGRQLLTQLHELANERQCNQFSNIYQSGSADFNCAGLFGGIHAPQHFFEVFFDAFIAKAGSGPQGFAVEHQY
jgi:hypothetical protein